MKKLKFQTLTGMHDVLPDNQRYFKKILESTEKIADFYGFKRIETPVLEETKLFEKGTGESSELVQKQMYSFCTKGGDFLTLRPEFTPGIVRAYIEHGMQNLPQPVKLFSFGPLFRYERPQAGRFRQFHQFNFEIFGEKSPIIDAQIIQVFYNILKELRFKNLIIEINSIGDPHCRLHFKKILINYFKPQQADLCLDCRRRLRENPLRILDCKKERCIILRSQAPQIIDHICDECSQHFKEVLEFLDELELPYRFNPYLVRGLDYYTKTVFEISIETEEGSQKQGALLGGGRFDALVKLLGGEDTPACGAAAGVERIIELMKENSTALLSEQTPEIFLAQIGNLARQKSLKLFETFYKERIRVAESFGRDSLRAQLEIANKIKVKFTLILGQKEATEKTIIIRDMEIGNQKIVKLDKVVKEIKKRLKSKKSNPIKGSKS